MCVDDHRYYVTTPTKYTFGSILLKLQQHASDRSSEDERARQSQPVSMFIGRRSRFPYNYVSHDVGAALYRSSPCVSARIINFVHLLITQNQTKPNKKKPLEGEHTFRDVAWLIFHLSICIPTLMRIRGAREIVERWFFSDKTPPSMI